MAGLFLVHKLGRQLSAALLGLGLTVTRRPRRTAAAGRIAARHLPDVPAKDRPLVGADR